MKFYDKKILSFGSYVPTQVITNHDLAAKVATTHEWVRDHLGIHERRIEENMFVAELGALAATNAILKWDKSVENIDAVIVSCSSPSHFAPSISNQIIKILGIQRPAFDINAVCSGFVYALELGCSMLNSGYKNILIVATERYSTITDWTSRDCVYFGDGAGAVILGHGDGEIVTRLYANGLSGNAFVARAGQKFSIVGRAVFDEAMRVLPSAVQNVLNEAGMTISDIDVVLPHQAGLVLVRRLMQEIGMNPSRCVTVMDKYANLASASIPIALDELQTKRGEELTMLLMTIGSGWTWGTAIIHQKL